MILPGTARDPPMSLCQVGLHAHQYIPPFFLSWSHSLTPSLTIEPAPTTNIRRKRQYELRDSVLWRGHVKVRFVGCFFYFSNLL